MSVRITVRPARQRYGRLELGVLSPDAAGRSLSPSRFRL
jgi:hypothetical protein